MSMKIVIVEPGKPGYAAEIEGGLASMQQVVGGYIEVVSIWSDDSAVLVCNEEGKLQDLPPNRHFEQIADTVVGTFFVCNAREEDLESLSEQQTQRYLVMFASPGLYPVEDVGQRDSSLPEMSDLIP